MTFRTFLLDPSKRLQNDPSTFRTNYLYSHYVVFTFHHKNRPEVSAYQNLRL